MANQEEGPGCGRGQTRQNEGRTLRMGRGQARAGPVRGQSKSGRGGQHGRDHPGAGPVQGRGPATISAVPGPGALPPGGLTPDLQAPPWPAGSQGVQDPTPQTRQLRSGLAPGSALQARRPRGPWQAQPRTALGLRPRRLRERVSGDSGGLCVHACVSACVCMCICASVCVCECVWMSMRTKGIVCVRGVG